ncbi:DUF724 domain-containing protein 3-like isoform X2 [Salvia splendens]|uniref:DUF724 domain-containing protein 3-like isoform X2 n=1 Tax=Salvia splendens TaxID=180675 RepID=UPI001C268D76|nr:DUF724 domain-containing protein 3-like isoform X2 [Salvia splendens]
MATNSRILNFAQTMAGDAPHPLFQFQQTPSQITPHGHRRRRHHYFPIGSVVEVKTDEEDFRGVYFSATVLSPPNFPNKKKSRKLYVEYHDLLAHEDGLDRLREYVDASSLRPAPPLQQPPLKGYDLDDVVDAFYKDGWWTGVVTGVVARDERYVVTFPNPPDELEFGLGELRLHSDWVNGNWLRPQKHNIAGLMFDVGRKVEVSFAGEEFQDVWYPATILEDLGNLTFLVECNSVNSDNHSSAKARVDSLHIRPCPPLLKDKKLILFEKVDAFFDFGWWSGIITKELENSRYLVFFKQMNCDKEFNQSELRLHMEWKDDKWFTSSQEPSVPSLDDDVCQYITPDNSSASVAAAPLSNSVNEEDTCGKTQSSLISRNDKYEQFILENQKLSRVTVPLTKKRAYVSDSGGSVSHPLKKLREGNVVVANKKDGCDGSKIEILCGPEIPESLNNMEISLAQTTLDQSCSDHLWEENVQRKQRNGCTPHNASENIKSTSTILGKSAAQILPVEILQLGSGEKELDTAGNTKEGAQNEHAKRETELPIVIGLPCAEMRSSGKPESNTSRPSSNEAFISLNDQRHPVFDFTTGKITDGKQLGIGEINEKRKRVRQIRKFLLESTGIVVTGTAEHGGMEASILNQEMMMPNQEITANGQSGPGKRKLRMPKRILGSEHEVADVKEPVRLEENCSFKRRQMQITTGGRIAVKVRDSVGVSGGKVMVVNPTLNLEKFIEPHLTLDVEKVIEPQPSNQFDNEPLSKWIDEMHMSSVIDGSVMVPYTENGNTQGGRVGHDEASEMQPQSEIKSSGLVDTGFPSESNITGNVLDEGTQKQSESGRQSMPSVEETSVVLFDLNSENLSEDEAQASVTVDKGPVIPYQPPQSCMENNVAVVLDEDIEKRPENEALATTPKVDIISMISSQHQHSVGETVREHNEKQPENRRTPDAASVDKVALVLSEPEKLPFEKNTILWKTIQSFQVFQRLPQKPHFQPLENFRESSREGLAIGYMVTFSSIVERASKLQLTDPVSIMDDIMDTLTDLEKQGFEVGPIQDCINELLAIKCKQEKLANDTETINGQITGHRDTKARLERDIEEINEHIMKLQRKRSQAESAKEREEEEIAFLQVRLRETKDSIKTVKNDFEGKVSSIL